MGTDPADPAAVAKALADHLSHRFGGPVSLMQPPSAAAAGLDSWIHYVTFRGESLPGAWAGPLVVRIQPGASRFQSSREEGDIHAWCNRHGFPVPRMLVVFAPGELLDHPVQVMERVPGRPMADVMKTAPWRIPALARRLAGLHADLHAIPVGEWPGAHERRDIAARRLGPVRRWAAALQSPALDDLVARVEAFQPRLVGGSEPVVCHGDFHPLNVMIDGRDLWVLDWSDAALGDRHADVARTGLLFNAAPVLAASRAEAIALRAIAPALARAYRRAYSARYPIEPERLVPWEAVHLLQLHSQVLASAGGVIGVIGGGSGRPAPLGVAAWAERELTSRLTRLGV